MNKRKPNSTNALNEYYLDERCSLNKVLKIIGKRWTSEIMLLISKDVCRFLQIKECLDGISDNVLSSVLNELVKSEIIEKVIFQQVPLRVKYNLTKSGYALTQIMQNLCSWGQEHIDYEVRIKSTHKVKSN